MAWAIFWEFVWSSTDHFTFYCIKSSDMIIFRIFGLFWAQRDPKVEEYTRKLFDSFQLCGGTHLVCKISVLCHHMHNLDILCSKSTVLICQAEFVNLKSATVVDFMNSVFSGRIFCWFYEIDNISRFLELHGRWTVSYTHLTLPTIYSV